MIQEEKKKAAIAKMDSLARIEKENNNFRNKSKKLSSGLEIHFIERGKGVKPVEGDEIFIYYEGYLAINGVLFGTNRKDIMVNYDRYSKIENKGWYDPLKVPFSNEMQLIEGFKEALMMMNVGDKFMFLFLLN